MGPIRRTFNLICALALTVGSASVFVSQFLYAYEIYFIIPLSAGVGVVFGLYWLWADFINADPRPETTASQSIKSTKEMNERRRIEVYVVLGVFIACIVIGSIILILIEWAKP
jgi:hypothetical protein